MSQIFLRIGRNIRLDASIRKQVDRVAIDAFGRAALKISARVKNLMGRRLKENPTLNSILYGDLQVDFGLTPGMAREAVDTITEFILDSLEISVGRARGQFSANLVIEFNPDIEELQQLPIASYKSKGGEVHWLYWLLNRGTEIDLAGYEAVHTVDISGASRSGRGFMLKVGGMFRVPTKHAGTAASNFITKFIDSVEENIEAIVLEEMIRAFK